MTVFCPAPGLIHGMLSWDVLDAQRGCTVCGGVQEEIHHCLVQGQKPTRSWVCTCHHIQSPIVHRMTSTSIPAAQVQDRKDSRLSPEDIWKALLLSFRADTSELETEHPELQPALSEFLAHRAWLDSCRAYQRRLGIPLPLKAASAAEDSKQEEGSQPLSPLLVMNGVVYAIPTDLPAFDMFGQPLSDDADPEALKVSPLGCVHVHIREPPHVFSLAIGRRCHTRTAQRIRRCPEIHRNPSAEFSCRPCSRSSRSSAGSCGRSGSQMTHRCRISGTSLLRDPGTMISMPRLSSTDWMQLSCSGCTTSRF